MFGCWPCCSRTVPPSLLGAEEREVRRLVDELFEQLNLDTEGLLMKLVSCQGEERLSTTEGRLFLALLDKHMDSWQRSDYKVLLLAVVEKLKTQFRETKQVTHSQFVSAVYSALSATLRNSLQPLNDVVRAEYRQNKDEFEDVGNGPSGYSQMKS